MANKHRKKRYTKKMKGGGRHPVNRNRRGTSFALPRRRSSVHPLAQGQTRTRTRRSRPNPNQGSSDQMFTYFADEMQAKMDQLKECNDKLSECQRENEALKDDIRQLKSRSRNTGGSRAKRVRDSNSRQPNDKPKNRSGKVYVHHKSGKVFTLDRPVA
jgi:hypothetical protein